MYPSTQSPDYTVRKYNELYGQYLKHGIELWNKNQFTESILEYKKALDSLQKITQSDTYKNPNHVAFRNKINEQREHLKDKISQIEQSIPQQQNAYFNQNVQFDPNAVLNNGNQPNNMIKPQSFPNIDPVPRPINNTTTQRQRQNSQSLEAPISINQPPYPNQPSRTVSQSNTNQDGNIVYNPVLNNPNVPLYPDVGEVDDIPDNTPKLKVKLNNNNRYPKKPHSNISVSSKLDVPNTGAPDLPIYSPPVAQPIVHEEKPASKPKPQEEAQVIKAKKPSKPKKTSISPDPASKPSEQPLTKKEKEKKKSPRKDKEPVQDTESSHDKKKSKHSKKSNDDENTQHRVSPSITEVPDYLIDENDFELIKEIGAGNYGTVWYAKRKQTKNYCAIKFVNKSNLQNFNQVNFMREVIYLISAKHPAILRIIGFSLTQNSKLRPSIVTEYLSGGSIQDILDHPKPEIYNNTKRMISLYGIVSAMAFLHSKEINIIHRDLKPANVMLNEKMEPFVCDFGLSKAKQTEHSLRQTRPIGTPVYMAPELLTDEKYTPSVDVYAFGIMLTEIISLNMAFLEYQSVPPLITAILSGKRPKVEPGTVPPPFMDLAQRCWAQDYNDRPSFKEILKLFDTKQLILPDVDMNEYSAYIKKIRSS